ncbi:MAG TPA: hypothetical protein VM223_23350 [Planctomycetota bacterium]|nr:hypothetical protein [Planctomycetota bacterium]
MQRRFSRPDFSKKAKVERKPVPEPQPDPVDRSKAPREFHPAPYLIGGTLIVSIIISVVLLVSPCAGRKPAATAPSRTGDPVPVEQGIPILPPDGPVGSQWTEHRRVEPLPADQQPAQATAGQPRKPARPDEPEVVVIRRDAEGDLFDFSNVPVPRPANISDDVKKADELLEKGRNLIRRWDAMKTHKTSRALELIVDARETLKKAMDAYRVAADKSNDDPYIKSQYEAARGLYYLAMKSSPL